ncbi:MAG: Vitamin B12 dependent methionine synthase activation subunit [Clostridia bacterium]|nr:Vitamin B12 dependent methionine synthase activation subunit [Clostridia bacterium]
MNSIVYVKNYSAPKINKKEILRYLGVKEEISKISAIVDECLKEVYDKLSYKVCFCKFPIKIENGVLNLGFTTLTSKDLLKNLQGAKEIILFTATIGIGLDRLIQRYSAVSQVKAVVFQAIGAERIESLCNLFNSEIKKEYKLTKPRFSPGYGDFPLEVQKDIISVLSASKNIGVTLNESLLMSPSKSVTAIIGVSKN